MKIILLFSAVLVFAFQALEKPSLKEIGSGLKKTSKIQELIKSTQTETEPFPKKAVDEVESLNKSPLMKWQNAAVNSTPFIRGEIDDESVLSQVLNLQQLSILKMREAARHKDFKSAREAISPWMTFAADLAYEEASLIGLRLANVLRSLSLDEIESLENLHGKEMAKDPEWLNWVGKMRAPWPIDRVILTESKRVIRNKGIVTAQQVAMALQKNAYQTASEALHQAPGPKVPELQFLEAMWREQDIQAMKTEITRIQALRIRLAQDRFLQQAGKAPDSVEELVTQKLLPSVPLNYLTGKAFTLADAAFHTAETAPAAVQPSSKEKPNK